MQTSLCPPCEHHEVVRLRRAEPFKHSEAVADMLMPPPLFFVPYTQQNQAAPNQRPAEGPKNQLRNQMWNGVLGIALVEGQDLPQYGQGDIYVRFRLGDQKYKSKVGHCCSFYLFYFLFFLVKFSFLSSHLLSLPHLTPFRNGSSL